MGRKDSEVSPSKRYPLRSTLNGGKALRSASNKNNTASNEALNGSAAAQPGATKWKSSTLLGSPNNSVRVLQSASEIKDDACSDSPSGSIAGKPDANKRKGVRPSKAASPINSVRVLRSASKNKDEICGKPLNGSATGEQAANERKCITPSKVGSPNNSVRVLRSASKTKNEAYSEPLNDNTVAQPSAKKSGSPLKMGSPASSARVLRSKSKRTNETFNEHLNDGTAAQPASRKRKSDTPPKGGSPKLGVRVLRSSAKKKDACVEPLNVSMPVQPAVKKRKNGKSSKECSPKKDYLKVCQRVRYVLNRMNYEQILIEAYAGEGWKGQSLEKIRPEKELERAKAEIMRCKIKIRETFRNMDSLLSEGKLEESLFDSAGEIFSEDIFCAICGSKDVTLKNDIILCDGACDRGFHQNCLNPPLRPEDIPPGDEGWFCPACVCKIDCIDALNELQGTKLSVHDSWEKVFPEAASLANDSKQHDASDLPLGDSEDNDYNPALAEGHMVQRGRSSAEEYNKVDDLGLPSDDSEDDDFDPAGPDSSEDQKSKSHSEESDFTSDSDYFCAEIAKSYGQGEVSVSPLSNVNKEICNHAFMETELDQDVMLPVSVRRQVERLDYKKLYDEAYGEESSSSSDDEEWSGKEKLEESETDGSVRPAKQRSRRASTGHPNGQHTPQIERCYGSVSEQQAEVLRSNGSNSATPRFGPIIKQKLKGHFEKDPYPSRATKESLAQELGLTFVQVDKWFASTRHSSRVAAAKKGKHTENHTTGNNDGMAADSAQVRVPNNEVLTELTAARNGMILEQVMAQNNLDEGNEEDILHSRAVSETEAYGKESSDPSDDKEWSGTSTSQEELEDTETDSLIASNRAKHLTRRAPLEPQNNEHTPLNERLHDSVNDRQTEASCSNGNSSKARKYHFGPIVNQKLKVHFEKDPYPSRSTVQSLAQELGLTFIQVRKWFSSSRHYSSVSAAKKGKDPGNHTNEKNDSTTVDSVQEKESNNEVMENPTKDINDMFSEKLMLQINLNEGNNDDIMFNQHTSCEETVVTTPTAISREVGPPGYGPGENQGYGESWNTISDQRIFMTPTTAIMSISCEVGPPGYGPGENQGNNASWNTSSSEGCPPGYGPIENQVSGASWNTSTERRVVMTPSTNPIEVGPPGYWPGGNQGTSASWNNSCAPTTTLSEVGPPGYWPRENKGNGASTNVGSPKGRSAEKLELGDEARKKAIARELRRMKKFR